MIKKGTFGDPDGHKTHRKKQKQKNYDENCRWKLKIFLKIPKKKWSIEVDQRIFRQIQN